MRDDEFLENLEECTLPDAEFHHAAHVRAGYLYLKRYSFPEAIGRMCSSIRAYATALGKPDRYHETITIGFLSLIHMRMRERGPASDWDIFKERNPELLSKEALLTFYPQEVLDSAEARAYFLLVPRA